MKPFFQKVATARHEQPKVLLFYGILSFLILLGILLRLYLIFQIGLFQEDALITLRYGWNLSHGEGLVFNPNEKVLGATSPLWTLYLGLLSAVFSHDTLLIAVSLSCLLCFGGIVASSLKILAAWQIAYPAQILVIAAMLFHINVTPISIAGMETSLFMFLLLASLYAASQNQLSASVILAAMTTLTRPEGVLWSGCLFFFLALTQRRSLGRALLLYFLLIAPWFIFATVYYGSPIPQSAAAKTAWLGSDPSLTDILWRPRHLLWILKNFIGTEMYRVRTLLLNVAFFTAVMTGGIAWMIMYLRREATALLAAAFFLVYVSFYYLGGALMLEWHFVPATLIFILVSAFTFDQAARLTGHNIWQYLFVLGIGLVLFSFSFRSLHEMRLFQQYENEVRRPLGEYLHDCAGTTDRVMLEPIGYIGYFSQRQIVDLAGLVTRGIVEQRNQGVADWAIQMFRQRQPEYIVLRQYEISENKFFAYRDKPIFLTAADRAWFDEHYQELKLFSSTSDAPPADNMVIYKRLDVATACDE